MAAGTHAGTSDVSEPNVFSLLNMLGFATEAAGCTVSAKIDLRKGYHQILVNPAGISRTVITAPLGLFEYLHLPLGLRSVASTFQRYID
jgi:hypothetical protein